MTLLATLLHLVVFNFKMRPYFKSSLRKQRRILFEVTFCKIRNLFKWLKHREYNHSLWVEVTGLSALSAECERCGSYTGAFITSIKLALDFLEASN